MFWLKPSRTARTFAAGDETIQPRELLHDFFLEQVRLRPDCVALEAAAGSLTYSELNQLADAIAGMLGGRGIGPGSLIGIFIERSPLLIAAILGTLKAGAGYIPIDSRCPTARIQAIIEDSNAALLLTDAALQKSLSNALQVPAICLDLNELKYSPIVSLRPVAVSPRDIAYVIYTSGSTGKPKGVVIEHRNAVAYVGQIQSLYGLVPTDRVYQGFSIAFDASVEEVWGALAVGATLVLPEEETARSALDATEFIAARRITFWTTVPSFLALIKPDLPSLRVLILGGEVCVAELVNRWMRPGLRIFNTYGPTETTVVATACECSPGAAVTIGKALPGYKLYVLDEECRPVAAGECGELYIGGQAVARGYINNAGLTAAKFVPNPFEDDHTVAPTLYRTADLVRRTDDGQLQFVGRADRQTKIRGFRIELSEIEALLMQHPRVKAAAANVVEVGRLKDIAAYVVLRGAPEPEDRRSLAELLRRHLPEYMVPKYLELIDDIPLMTSGKLDRDRLPPPRTLTGPAAGAKLPETALERAIADVWMALLQMDEVGVEQDFFLDLHGHSLMAAEAVTALREQFDTNSIAVRDIYRLRTVRALAAHLARIGVGEKAPSRERPTVLPFPAREDELPATRWFCAALQFVALVCFYGIITAPVACLVLLALRVMDGDLDWAIATQIGTVLGFAAWPTWLGTGILLKWIVIGRYKPGEYPLWKSYYLRWWIVTRFQQLGWPHMFVGSPLMSLYYRAMGAKVGRRALIGSPLCAAFDLLSIGDDTTIGPDTHMLGYRVEDGLLKVGSIALGAGCFVGTHCYLGLNVAMGDEARLDDMSTLPDGCVIAAGHGQRGSPPVQADVMVPPPGRRAGRIKVALLGMLTLALIYLMGYILILSMLPSIGLTVYAFWRGGPIWGVMVTLMSVPIGVCWYLKIVLTIKRRFIGQIRPGTYSIYGLTYLRFWFLTYLLNNTRTILLPLYATIYMPRVLRKLGAKIGSRVEVSTIMHVMPDLLEVGDESFLADGCIIGSYRISHGTMEIHANRIGTSTFVGNSAFIPAGVTIGDGNLVGVLSTTPAETIATENNTRFLGSPGFILPRTQSVTCFTARQTFKPGLILVLMRGIVDLVRVLLPGLLLMAASIAFCAAVAVLYRLTPLWVCLSIAPVAACVVGLGTIGGVVFLKFALMGTYQPVVRPLWCSYVWFNEVVNALFEAVAAPLLSPLMGTPLICVLLRLLGCKIGRWVFLETTLLSEFDLVEIGDGAAVNLGCTVQTHLFEDRVMKADRVKIGQGCSIGNLAVVLYATEMGRGSVLAPMSVLMKGERLPDHTRWTGIPTQPVDGTGPMRRAA